MAPAWPLDAHPAERDSCPADADVLTQDPWGTRIRLRVASGSTAVREPY